MKCIDDEIPFEIPRGWEWCRLGAIGSWGSGATPSKGHPEFYGGSIPWLTTGELNESYVFDTKVKVTEKALACCSLRKCATGDVLIAMYGATIGKVAIAGCELTTNQACCACTPYYNYNKYLFYFLMSNKLNFIKMGEGGAQPNISKEKIVATLCPLPPLNEQRRIVNVVESLIPKIEHFTTLQANLEELNASIFTKLRKSILQEAIQGRFVPQDPADEPASVLLERIREEKQRLLKEGKLKKKDITDSVIFKGDDNKYYEKIGNETVCIDEEIPFDIPRSWSWTRLGFLVSNETGLSYSKDCLSEKSSRMIRVLRGGNIEEGRWLTKDDDVMISASYVKDELILKRGTFITPAVTSIERMAKTALVEVDQSDIVVGGFVLMLKPFIKDDSLLRYLILLFQSVYYKQYCISITNKSGQAFYNISRQKLMKCLVPIAPMKEMSRIAEKIASLNL